MTYKIFIKAILTMALLSNSCALVAMDDWNREAPKESVKGTPKKTTSPTSVREHAAALEAGANRQQEEVAAKEQLQQQTRPVAVSPKPQPSIQPMPKPVFKQLPIPPTTPKPIRKQLPFTPSSKVDPNLTQKPLPAPEQSATTITKIPLQDRIEQLKQQQDDLKSKLGTFQSRVVSSESAFKSYQSIEDTLKKAQAAEKAGNTDEARKLLGQLSEKCKVQIAYLEDTLRKVGENRGVGYEYKSTDEVQKKIRTDYDTALKESNWIAEQLKLSPVHIKELLAHLSEKTKAAEKIFSQAKEEFVEKGKALAPELNRVTSELKKAKENLVAAEKTALSEVEINAKKLTAAQVKTNIKELKIKLKYATKEKEVSLSEKYAIEESKKSLTSQIRIFEDELKTRKERLKKLKKLKQKEFVEDVHNYLQIITLNEKTLRESLKNTEGLLAADPNNTTIRDLHQKINASLNECRAKKKSLEAKYGDEPIKFNTLKAAIAAAKKNLK